MRRKNRTGKKMSATQRREAAAKKGALAHWRRIPKVVKRAFFEDFARNIDAYIVKVPR